MIRWEKTEEDGNWYNGMTRVGVNDQQIGNLLNHTPSYIATPLKKKGVVK